MKFKHLQALQITEASLATYDLYEVEGVLDKDGKPRVPKLFLRIAGEANRPYWKEIVKRAAVNAKRLKGGSDKDGRQAMLVIAENREHDRELFPEHVLAGWEDLPGDDGQAVPFSRENAREFFAQLPAWLLDRIRNFAADPTNHINEPTRQDAEEASGN